MMNLKRKRKVKPTIDMYQSQVDGVWVVHVDTHGLDENKKGPIIRVYINDEPVFENPSLLKHLRTKVYI
jgi:hypothetical protein